MVWLGTGIALPGTHPAPPSSHTPGTPPLHHGSMLNTGTATPTGVKVAVGLKSVRQLTLDAQISGFEGMTEVYNLVRIGK